MSFQKCLKDCSIHLMPISLRLPINYRSLNECHITFSAHLRFHNEISVVFSSILVQFISDSKFFYVKIYVHHFTRYYYIFGRREVLILFKINRK